jgi:hypothetical protein
MIKEWHEMTDEERTTRINAQCAPKLHLDINQCVIDILKYLSGSNTEIDMHVSKINALESECKRVADLLHSSSTEAEKLKVIASLNPRAALETLEKK